MTVSYQYEVASSTSGGFTRLLFMWRGSLYKLIYRELLLFLLAFCCLSAIYRNILSLEQRRLFEKVVLYCDTFMSLIPLSFVLGFYVAYVATRWWQQYVAIPWPDKTMHTIALYLQGDDERGRIIRRTMMRYLNLSLILVLRSISSAVKRRFPTMEHLIEAGFMTPTELQMFQSVPSKEFNTYWIPCTWFTFLLKQARKEKRIVDSMGVKVIVEEFNEFRSKCGLLWSYDWISIPLVYTQVVTLATYSFFLAALVGRQFIDSTNANVGKKLQMEIDIYLPVFTILQFFFFMGLLKVAEQLINPFGDDDEDFELNWLIDRHTKVSYLVVDTLINRCPPLVKDKYFDDVNVTLPYTGAAVAYKKKTYRGSVHNMQVPEEQQSMFLPEIIEEDDEDTMSTKISTPKASLNSVLHNAAKKTGGFSDSASEAAGILRQENSFPMLHHPAYMEGDLQYMEMGLELEEGSVLPNQSDLLFWPSNSTLESNTSTIGLVEDVPNGIHTNNNNKNNNNNSKIFHCNSELLPENYFDPSVCKVQRSISSVFSNTKKPQNIGKYNSTSDIFVKQNNVRSENAKRKLYRLLGRRQSSSSGQWKGVRWKPVIDDAAGDCWSDNSNLKHSKRINTPPPLLLPQQQCNHRSCWPLTSLSVQPQYALIRPGIPHHSEPNIDVISEIRQGVVGISLPNISVAFSSNQENKNSLRTLQSSKSIEKCGKADTSSS